MEGIKWRQKELVLNIYLNLFHTYTFIFFINTHPAHSHIFTFPYNYHCSVHKLSSAWLSNTKITVTFLWYLNNTLSRLCHKLFITVVKISNSSNHFTTLYQISIIFLKSKSIIIYTSRPCQSWKFSYTISLLITTNYNTYLHSQKYANEDTQKKITIFTLYTVSSTMFQLVSLYL